jgi:hypothetical protein
MTNHHSSIIEFTPLNVDIIKLFLNTSTIDFSLLEGYDEEEIFFFLDIINPSEGCRYCIYAKVFEIVPLRVGFGMFNTIGTDVEARFLKIVTNLDIIYEAKSYMMPDDVRVEFKRALDLLKEAHKFSLFQKKLEVWSSGMIFEKSVFIPMVLQSCCDLAQFIAILLGYNPRNWPRR